VAFLSLASAERDIATGRVLIVDGELAMMGAMTRRFAVLALCVIFSAAAHAAQTELRFLRDGEVVKQTDLESLKKACPLAAVVIEDPYYKKTKSFLAFPLKQVLSFGFGQPAAELVKEDLFFQALDGYVKPASGERALEDGGYLAFADADRTRGSDPGWEPIDRRGADPGPYYVVWAKPGQTDAKGYPWPFELAAIEIVHFEKKYPDTLPRSAPADSAAWKGFATFRMQCISCHSVNGQGGKIGPDLNVPRSIVEYRPIDQVKAYIRDPETFRHSNMPAHRDLTGAELDDLIAYFSTMKTLKHDPGK
jgi:mono/diheme cytochrome c family protein